MNHTVQALAKITKKTPSSVELFWRQAKRLHTNRGEKNQWLKILRTTMVMLKYGPVHIPEVGEVVSVLGLHGAVIEASADFFVLRSTIHHEMVIPLISIIFCDEPTVIPNSRIPKVRKN